VRIAFTEARNEHDLSAALPMFYLQIKAYVLRYAQCAGSVSMSYYSRAEDISEGVDIIGVSSTTQNFFDVISYGQTLRAKHPAAILVLGGHHISFLPHTLPPEYDLGVLFEGEETFTQVVDAYEASRGARTGLRQLKGIVWHDDGGQIVVNPRQDPIQPLDRIPFPVMEGDEAPYIFSSRGCPYHCSFCASTAFWNTVRYFPAEYVVAQVRSILERFPATKQIIFWDDLVVSNRARFASIVEQIEGARLNTSATFGFAVRANLVDEELCRLLARLRVAFVSLGAESGSPRILRLLKGDSVTVEHNQRALDLLSHYGIGTICGFVVGVPTETREDLQKTFDFILRNTAAEKMLHNAVNVLMPLPGTQMWDYAVQQGIIAEPIDWKRFQVFASYKTSSFRNIKEWGERRRALNSYYLNQDCVPHVELLAMLAELEEKLAKTYAELRAAAERRAACLLAANPSA